MMDFTLPAQLLDEKERFREFLRRQMEPHMAVWYHRGEVPRSFHLAMGAGGWFNFEWEKDHLKKLSSGRAFVLGEQISLVSPGIAVAALAHVDLGMTALWLFGSESLQGKYGKSAIRGETLFCLGNTEKEAGTDVSALSTAATKVNGGWVLNGTKAYVTNGLISDMAVITAVTDAEAARNNRFSMFLVDLNASGVRKTKLNKQVWIPSDLTRLQLSDVFVPKDHLMGVQGHGLQQVLTVFTYSRVPISALTLATASGAFELAMEHAQRRRVLGQRLLDFQAKAFEIADFYARMEAARLMVWKACWAMDSGRDFRMESSLAKYLSVMIAREVTTWAADLFGAASVILQHPIHKYPMDAWASSLGEGTQDVQKLVIFRELMKRHAKAESVSQTHERKAPRSPDPDVDESTP
jgi:alkylation response protein AidB-like acyl-CoA dehydrogenase